MANLGLSVTGGRENSVISCDLDQRCQKPRGALLKPLCDVGYHLLWLLPLGGHYAWWGPHNEQSHMR